MNIINIGSLKLISGLKASQFPTALHNCQFNIKYFQLLPLTRVSNKKSPIQKSLHITISFNRVQSFRYSITISHEFR